MAKEEKKFKRKIRFNNITILGLLTYFSENIQVRLLGVVVALPIIIVACIIYYGYISILDERTELNKSITYLTETRSVLFIDSITENYKKAKLQTSFVKEDIVEDLNKEYGNDLERMHRDYNAMDYNNKFFSILSSNINYRFLNKPTNRNRIFIANKDGILIDNSSSYSSNSYTKWDDIIEKSISQVITKDTINHIKDAEKDEPLLWIDQKSGEVITPSNMPKFNPDASPIDFIEACAMGGNIKELENYSIIAVSYIYDNEDIFGTPDVSAGHDNDNEKIYVIQVVSIKDIIESNPELSKSLNKLDNMIKERQEFASDSVHFKTICIILLSIMGIMTFFGIWYLAEFYVYFKFSKRSVERDMSFKAYPQKDND